MVANHTNIKRILGDSFRSCLKSGNVESVKSLLYHQSEDGIYKSTLLNETDNYGRTALMFSIKSGNAKCLELIVTELDADLESIETESTDEKQDEIETDCNDIVDDLHKMYRMVDAKGDNILHYLFSDPNRSANDKQLDVLKNVLTADQFRGLLGQRNLSDEHPLHKLVCNIGTLQLNLCPCYLRSI